MVVGEMTHHVTGTVVIATNTICGRLLAAIETIALVRAPLLDMIDVVGLVRPVVAIVLRTAIMVVMVVEVVMVKVETTIVNEAQIAFAEVLALVSQSRLFHRQVQSALNMTLPYRRTTSRVSKPWHPPSDTTQRSPFPSPQSNTLRWRCHVSDSSLLFGSPSSFCVGDANLSVSSSEETLRGIFAAFGIVQTCIVNVDKRHAFVKMLTRTDAMSAKEGMERYKSADMQLRVGFELFLSSESL